MTPPVSGRATSVGPGRSITKYYDMSSPYLAKALEDGRRFDEVVVAVPGHERADDGGDDRLVVSASPTPR